jgi:DNA ligase (NAD+)
MLSLHDLLDPDVLQARAAELERNLRSWREAYYNGNALVPDEEYDSARDELAELKPRSPEVVAVGATPPEISEWKKVRHAITMGSLDKVQTLDELTKWVQGFGGMQERLLVTEKLDGMSIEIHYQAGVFAQAATRGDGVIGEDISVNVAKMRGVPGRLPKKFTGTVRGEVIITKTDFRVHFANDYENTRNTAAGISKRFDGKGCELLQVMFYQVVDGKDFVTEADQFEWLEQAGFKTPNWYVTTMTPGIKTPHDLWVEYQQTKRDALDYEIDGLVVRLENMARQIALGEKDGRPLGATAFKFAPYTRESTCLEIQNQTGGMGVITPVCVFEPIRLGGVTVTNASLYNWKYIRDLGLDVGARILVARANDVIPRVVRVTTGTGTVAQPPKECPSCAEPPEFHGEHLICPNTWECPQQTEGRVKRYVKSLDIKEWGDILIEKLVALGLVKNVSDLYRLTEEQISGIERMGARSAQNVLKTLWAKNPISLEDLLGSMSIPMCASSTLKLAVDAGYDNLERVRTVTFDQLSAIKGFGPERSDALVNWLYDHIGVVDDLLAAGVKIKPRIKGTLTGKSFCFTGTSNRPRSDLEDLVRGSGGEVKTTVSKKLTYLVTPGGDWTSSKVQAAKRNGTHCITEDDFLKMVGP